MRTITGRLVGRPLGLVTRVASRLSRVGAPAALTVAAAGMTGAVLIAVFIR